MVRRQAGGVAPTFPDLSSPTLIQSILAPQKKDVARGDQPAVWRNFFKISAPSTEWMKTLSPNFCLAGEGRVARRPAGRVAPLLSARGAGGGGLHRRGRRRRQIHEQHCVP